MIKITHYICLLFFFAFPSLAQKTISFANGKCLFTLESEVGFRITCNNEYITLNSKTIEGTIKHTKKEKFTFDYSIYFKDFFLDKNTWHLKFINGHLFITFLDDGPILIDILSGENGEYYSEMIKI